MVVGGDHELRDTRTPGTPEDVVEGLRKGGVVEVAMGVDENDLIPEVRHAASVLKTAAGFKFQDKGGCELRVASYGLEAKERRRLGASFVLV